MNDYFIVSTILWEMRVRLPKTYSDEITKLLRRHHSLTIRRGKLATANKAAISKVKKLLNRVDNNTVTHDLGYKFDPRKRFRNKYKRMNRWLKSLQQKLSTDMPNKFKEQDGALKNDMREVQTKLVQSRKRAAIWLRGARSA